MHFILLDFKMKPTNLYKKKMKLLSIDDLYIFPLIFTCDNIYDLSTRVILTLYLLSIN